MGARRRTPTMAHPVRSGGSLVLGSKESYSGPGGGHCEEGDAVKIVAAAFSAAFVAAGFAALSASAARQATPRSVTFHLVENRWVSTSSTTRRARAFAARR